MSQNTLKVHDLNEDAEFDENGIEVFDEKALVEEEPSDSDLAEEELLSAKALKAKVLLSMGNFDEAYKLADEVITKGADEGIMLEPVYARYPMIADSLVLSGSPFMSAINLCQCISVEIRSM